MEIKNLEKKIDAIIGVVGNEVSSSFKAPSTGNVTVKDMSVVEGRDQQNADGTTTHIREWVRVDFNEGGSLSLRSLLISPDITWNNKPTQTDRVKALATAKLFYTHSESKTSKAGNPYKVAHVTPITL